MILNPNYKELMQSIQHKMNRKPELGRILTDKKYDKVSSESSEVALWAHVKEERRKIADAKAKIDAQKMSKKHNVFMS